MNEIWLPVVELDGRYEISNLGSIRSVFTEITEKNGKHKKHKPRVLKPSKTTTGYYKIEARDIKTGVRKSYKLHRLVANAFIENTECKPNINHKDNNPLNNNINNLEWCTQSENIKHGYKIGAHKKGGYIYSDNHNKKAVDCYTKGMSTQEIANKLNIERNTVLRILKRNDVPIKGSKNNSKIKEFKILFELGVRNRDIANVLNCSTGLVATRKYQHKRGII